VSALTKPSSAQLARRLEELAKAGDRYWDFVGRDAREHVHSLFHYPAMMVPRLQRDLIETCIGWDPTIRLIADPFVGSGTVMTETMSVGRDFTGTDINPLAILVCRAKAECLNAKALSCDLRRLLRFVASDTSERIEARFPNRDKWFERHVQVGLSRLHRAIQAGSSARARRFWWVVLAETVRLTSNSRTSTAKLHLRPPAEFASRPNPCTVFEQVAQRNLESVRIQCKLLANNDLVHRGKYVGRCSLRVADASHPASWMADLMVTSPPYGDNHTTMAYGQASYLPLQWIDPSDIAEVGLHSPSSIREIDSASIGGSWTGALQAVEPLLDRSPQLRRTWDHLRVQPRDRRVRVAAYFRDLDACLASLMTGLRRGAVMVWTVADRSVGGERIPLSAALPELIGDRAELVTAITRGIPQSRKSMPANNSTGQTMRRETILILRMASSQRSRRPSMN